MSVLPGRGAYQRAFCTLKWYAVKSVEKDQPRERRTLWEEDLYHLAREPLRDMDTK
jgi:hypothetical protein